MVINGKTVFLRLVVQGRVFIKRERCKGQIRGGGKFGNHLNRLSGVGYRLIRIVHDNIINSRDVVLIEQLRTIQKSLLGVLSLVNLVERSLAACLKADQSESARRTF